MKILKISTSAILIAVFATAPLQATSQTTEDQVAIKLAEAMEKFYGKNIKDVNKYLQQQYGIKTPMKKEGSTVTYIVPVSDPLCGSINLDTDGKQVVGLQTMTWNRNDENAYGRACELAFKKSH
jgi:hypothetical protein